MEPWIPKPLEELPDMKLALVTLALVSLSAPAQGEPTSTNSASTRSGSTQSADQSTPTPATAKEQLVCRRVAASESRVAARRVCLTRSQWQQRDRDPN